MKIAIMGAGAIGGYFGGRLADAGYDVSFIARGAHLEAIKANGLKVLSPLGDFAINPATATDNPAEIGPVDVVLFMVKNYDTLQAAEQIKPLIGPDTAVIPFQNGVEARAMLEDAIGTGHVMGGVAFIPASLPEPGVIQHNADLAKLVFGEFDKQITPRAVAFLDALIKAGVIAEISDDINVVLWSKLMFLTSMSALNCLTRQPCGLVQEDEETMALYMDAMREVAAVARAHGVNLGEEAVASNMALAQTFPPKNKTSMYQDLEAGRRLEIKYLSGAVVRLGIEKGVETPIHRTAWVAIKPWIDGPPA
ncbi:MAG: 2-dehydropantoate 2-reductase [Alphaproteobacteria bacterium]|nr:2-dehydropantoate 2-reductase [Alphaproteobacteria bacterium]MBT4083373.1 2-dehydropantoate 2-reductase [Alphaproteobacteria bacterium]MBT4542975.1 2-dehydropantoate 2-reductase [Alphaproteobacteria bacterium]MBT5920239.1 2-dehydropantoate 2-reductase [Alphaproteobacteria bacterium]MBT6384443.1 2-dehydropantoate 2-reductase [Alphaproteobacteria bacterium]